MANTVQIKRGNTSSVSSYTGPSGEVIYNTDTNRLHSQDGSVAGGHPHALMSDVNTKANSSVTISAGDGLTGGGNLTVNRTLSLNPSSIASLAKADSSVQSVNGEFPVSGNVTVTAEEKRLQDTTTTAIAESFLSNVQFVETAGYSSVGDGGGALYKRVSSEPSHAGKVQSADGAWWELAETEPNVKMFGAIGDGVASDQTAIVGAVGYTYSHGLNLYWPSGEYTSTASIPNFHDVNHFGPGAVKRVGLGDELVKNRHFTTSDNWSLGGATISGGKLNLTGSVAPLQTIALVAGKTYEITYTTSNVTAGSVHIRLDDGIAGSAGDVLGTPRTTNGQFTQRLTAIASSTTIQIVADSSFSGSVDEISVREVDAVSLYYVDPSMRTNETLTYRIPSFFPDLQTAWNYLSRYKPGAQVVANVLLEADYVIEKGFRIDDADLSWCQLSSVDTIVTVSPTFEHVSVNDIDAGVARSNLYSFIAYRSRMPRWNILLDHAASITAGGYCLFTGAEGVVRNYKGLINADFDEGPGTYGIGFRVGGGSKLIAPYGIANGCGAGFAVTQNSIMDVQFASAKNCRETGIDVSRNATCYALSSNVDGCYRGFYVRRSRLVAETAIITNCDIGLQAQASAWVSLINAVMDGTVQCVRHDSGAFIEATGATKSGSPLGLTDVFPQAFNTLSGSGALTDQDKAPGNAPQLTATRKAQQITSGSQSVAALSYHTAMSVTGDRQVLGGSIYGANVGVRITVDGEVVLNDVSQAVGQDAGGDNITVISIPPIAAKSTLVIEVYNRDGSVARTIGWKIFRVI